MYNSLHKLKLPPKITKNFGNKILKSHQDRYEIFEEKPLYKMKIFNNVESKVVKKIKEDQEKLKARTLNAFYNTNNNQTKGNYNQNKQNYGTNNNFYGNTNNRNTNYRNNGDENIDKLINQVEGEIKEMN